MEIDISIEYNCIFGVLTVCPKDNLYFYKLLTISIPDKGSHLYVL